MNNHREDRRLSAQGFSTEAGRAALMDWPRAIVWPMSAPIVQAIARAKQAFASIAAACCIFQAPAGGAPAPLAPVPFSLACATAASSFASNEGALFSEAYGTLTTGRKRGGVM